MQQLQRCRAVQDPFEAKKLEHPLHRVAGCDNVDVCRRVLQVAHDHGERSHTATVDKAQLSEVDKHRIMSLAVEVCDGFLENDRSRHVQLAGQRDERYAIAFVNPCFEDRCVSPAIRPVHLAPFGLNSLLTLGQGQGSRRPGAGVWRRHHTPLSRSVRRRLVASREVPISSVSMNREIEARLVVLVADGSESRREAIAETIRELGHDVVARESSLAEIARITAMEHPDVAIVVVNEAGEHALKLIDRIVHEATCPVIAVLDVEDRAFVREAAKRGIFAYIAGDESEELQSSIDIVLRRFAEYHNLEAAFGRRAITERAKGILMERHGIDEDAAFAMLRDHARRHGLKVVDLAQSVASVRALLPHASSEERLVGESQRGDLS